MEVENCQFCHSETLLPIENFGPDQSIIAELCEQCFSIDISSLGNELLMSDFIKADAENYVEAEVRKLNLSSKSLVLQIGSGDGSLLKFFKAKSIPCFGFEPDMNLANIAMQKHVTTIQDEFTIKHAWELLAESNDITHGQKIDLVIANNIVGRGIETAESLEAIRLVMKDEGSVTFEEKWVASLSKDKLRSTKKPSIYISSTALMNELESHDLDIVDIENSPDSGTLRWTARAKGLFSVSPAVVEYLGYEQSLGLDSIQGVIKYLER